MADFCTIRPANDAVALELSAWCAGLFADIRVKHTLATDLCAAAVTRAAAAAAVSNKRCVLFFGHGSPSALLMAKSAGVLDTLNIAGAAGAILVAIACNSAALLGPDAILNGVESYLGFNGPLTWISGDPDGKFQTAATSGIREMLLGGSTTDAHVMMWTDFGDAVSYYRGAGRARPNSTLGWLTAFWDQQHLVLLGNQTATV